MDHRSWGALLVITAAAAQAEVSPAVARGELLYTTYCQGCHTTQVHWREKRLATDRAGLAVQVERWQVNGRLGWSAEDVDAVVRYLDVRYYRFPDSRPAAGAGAGAPRS
ncbi:MAG TPA: cytochrome C [Casimicrobiaceae bacterium]|nr:cytochrome C [Casimicrobiaceae bacterium]